MAKYTIITGALLILLGVFGYLSHDTVTVLIPAFLGAIIALLGALALKTERRRKFIHIAVVVVVIGLAGSVTSLSSIPTLLSCEAILTCDDLARPLATLYKTLMALVLIPYFVTAISFFIKARLSK